MGPLIPGPDAPAFGFGLAPRPGPMGAGGRSALTRLTELAGRGLRGASTRSAPSRACRRSASSVNRYTARLPLYLVGNIHELDYGRRDLPLTVHYIGNASGTRRRRPRRRAALAGIRADRPWVHVADSTLASGEPRLLRAAVGGLADEPVEVLISTGGAPPPEELDLGALPANAHVARWYDHGELLPRCAALVTVGGKATILAAAEAGVPMVVVPTTWDKPDNARRVTHAGAGAPARAALHAGAPARGGPGGGPRAAPPQGRAAARDAARRRSRAARGRPPARRPHAAAPGPRGRPRRRGTA